MSAKVLIERMELVRHLVDEAQRLAPERITFHWSYPCQVAPSTTHLLTGIPTLSRPSLSSQS